MHSELEEALRHYFAQVSLKLEVHKLVVICFSSVALTCVNGAYPPPCDSEIYCTGPILHQVQKAKLFDDDKYFVDLKLRENPDVVLSAFHNLSNESPNTTVPPAKPQEFLRTYFEKPGSEFESWKPPDWHPKPKFLEGIADKELRNWAEKLHDLWKSLGRKICAGVKDHPELHSMIYTPHPGVVPGGRFRELYYWNSYWVVNGLLLSEMTDTARGVIQNFLYLVNRYGFVPNGGRIYYERRSQPPFLTLMVESYYQATEDAEFLRWARRGMQCKCKRCERGAWFDFNLVTHSRRVEFYPSNLARCYSRPEMGEKAVQYLKGSGALQFPNAVPTSLRESEQQWDHPNAWPPLQHMLIDGLSKLPSEDAKQLASELAQRWIRTNWLAYVKHEAMFEKYGVNDDGKPGGGGEYDVQLGSGWTNGVALQLLNQYGATLTSGSRPVSPCFLPPLLISAALVLH